MKFFLQWHDISSELHKNLFFFSFDVVTKVKIYESYVYWTVHHLDRWIKIDLLDVTFFIISLFTAQHVRNVSTSIFRSLRLIVDLFHVLYCSGSMCVGVTVWFGWCGVVSLCRLKLCFSLHKEFHSTIKMTHGPIHLSITLYIYALTNRHGNRNFSVHFYVLSAMVSFFPATYSSLSLT